LGNKGLFCYLATQFGYLLISEVIQDQKQIRTCDQSVMSSTLSAVRLVTHSDGMCNRNGLVS